MQDYTKDNDIARSWSWTWTLPSNRWKRDFQKWRFWKCNNAKKCTPWDLLETCRHAWFLRCAQLNGTGSFSFACWCKRVLSARSCSDAMWRLTVCGPLFLCRKLFCFPLVEIQPIAACLQLRACPFHIFHHLSLFWCSKLSLDEPSEPSEPSWNEATVWYVRLQLRAQVRFRKVSHLEMIWDESSGLERFECFKFNT